MGEPVKLDRVALENAARAMWDVWQASPCCKEDHRGISWDHLVANADGSPRLRELVDTARSEAGAAIRTYINYAEAPEETANVLGALVGLQRHRCDDEAVKTWSGKAEELIRHLLVQLGGRGASVLGRATE